MFSEVYDKTTPSAALRAVISQTGCSQHVSTQKHTYVVVFHFIVIYFLVQFPLLSAFIACFTKRYYF